MTLKRDKSACYPSLWRSFDEFDSSWLPLAEAVERLVARGVQEPKAKVDICDAIAEMRLRVRVHANHREDGGRHPTVHETNDVEIPIGLNPQRLDWAQSRPAGLYPWRARSAQSADGWQDRRIALVEVSVEDFVVELRDDISSVRLPDCRGVMDHPPISADRIRDLRELAQAEWLPCQATVDALAGLAGRETISLSQAVSIMAFGSQVEPSEGDKLENDALKQQAGRALCVAAGPYEVMMRGSRNSPGNDLEPIPEMLFSAARCLGDHPNSLERDYERGDTPSSGSEQPRRDRRSKLDGGDDGRAQRIEAKWFNVEVDVASFLEWLEFSIYSEQERQLHRCRSRRLFDYPFWSIETALCWIAFRDSNYLDTRERLPRWARRRKRHSDKQVELQPEIRLLRALRDGKLKAREGVRVLSKGYWANCAPTPGGVSPASRSLRLAREDVLRTFPEKMRCLRADVRTCRQAKIDRIVERMRRTRKWVSCGEIADWCARGAAQASDHKSRRSRTFNRLSATFAAGGFRSGGRSQLRLLSPDTSVVRLSFKPVDRTVYAEGFRAASVSGPDYLERCWLPNEMCRRWFEQQRLHWPAHFDRTPTVPKEQPKTVQSPEPETRRKRGRPLRIESYVEEFERSLASRPLSKTLQEEANKLMDWGAKNLDREKRVKVGTLENHIRERLKTWEGPIPWKSN